MYSTPFSLEMSLLLFLGLNENSFCQWVRAFYLAKPSHWLVFVRNLRNGSSSFRLLPFLLLWVRNHFGAVTLNQLGFSKIVCFYVFKKYLFLFLFFAFFAIILTFVFLNFAKILTLSSPRDFILTLPPKQSLDFLKKKKNGCFLSANEHSWGVVLFLH